MRKIRKVMRRIGMYLRELPSKLNLVLDVDLQCSLLRHDRATMLMNFLGRRQRKRSKNDFKDVAGIMATRRSFLHRIRIGGKSIRRL
jgi:hypothetical protein